MRIVKNLVCFYLVLISFVYTQQVFLSITNLDSTGLEITMSNFEEVGGFQFDIDVGDGLDSLNVIGASGGTSADAGFTVSTNTGGTVLGFSFSGATIPTDSTGSTLVNVDVSFTGEEGSFSISSATISDPSANSIDVLIGEDYTISGPATGCTDESACNYDESATEDDGSCFYEEECTDCNGECSCYVDCSGECGGSDYGCFTTPDDLFGSWSIDNEVFFENSDCTGDVVTIYECTDDGEDYTSFEDCELNCNDECINWNDFLPSYANFNDDGTLDLFFLDEASPCSDDSECVSDTDEPDMLCGETGYCMMIGSEFWGIDPNGCFHTWEVDEYGQLEYGADEGCSTYIIDGDNLTITGDDDGYCQEINLSTTVIGCMDMVATNYDDEALSPCGDCCEYAPVETHYTVEINETGESSLFIFSVDIEGLNTGDELGLFDSAGVVDTLGNAGEILVGAGVWEGDQLNITAIHAVDLSQFNGPILPGATEGNTMSLKVWNVAEEMEYDVSYSVESGSGTFDGLFTAIDDISFGPPPHYNVEINETGESSLFIFSADIEGLNTYDEVALFDASGVIDTSGNTGEILVGAGVWEGDQLNITAIHAVDLSQFSGPILPGATEGNAMSLKVWNVAEEMEYVVTYSVESGSGTFDGLFTAINSISFVPPCEDDDSAVAPFTCESAVAQFGCDFIWGDALISDVCPETCDTCPVYGCTDDTACNYDSEATDDDGSCEYVVDCSGECGGDAAVDDCGVCDGSNADEDCAGVCFGDSFIDDCGYCVEGGTNPDDCLDADNGLPTEFNLSQNYPNPFNPSTNISFDVAESGNIDILVYDILGNYINTLISGFYSQGKYTVNWIGNDASGNSVASGIYIYQLIHDKVIITKKMTLLR